MAAEARQAKPRTLGSAATDAGSALLAAYTAHEAVNHASTAVSTIGAVRQVRNKAGKVVARGRAGGAPQSRAGGAPTKTAGSTPAKAAGATSSKRPAPRIPPSSPVSRASNAVNAVRAQSSAAISKATTVAAKVADTKGGQLLGKGLNAVANSKVASIAARASLPLLIARAGWNAGKGYSEDGIRGAGRGIIQTLDPTALISMLAGKTGIASSLAGSAGDGRGVAERLYDRALGSASKPHAREADHLSAPMSGSGEQRSTVYSSMIAHGTGMAAGAAMIASPSAPGKAGALPPQTKASPPKTGTDQQKPQPGMRNGERVGSDGKITRQSYQTKDGRTVEATIKQQEAYRRRRDPNIAAPKLARKVPS